MKEKVISMLALLLLAATGTVAQTTYKVTLKKGTEDATNWQGKAGEGEYQALPLEGVAAGTAVSVKYNGTKRVKSIRAVKAPAEGHALSASVVGDIVGSDGNAYAVADKDNLPQGVTAVAMVAYRSETAGSSLAIQLNASPEEKNWLEAKAYAEGLAAVSGRTWHLPSQTDWQNMFVGCAVSGDDTDASDNKMNPIAGFKEKIGATGTEWLSVTYWSSTPSTPSGSSAYVVHVSLGGSYAFAEFYGADTSFTPWVLGCLAF